MKKYGPKSKENISQNLHEYKYHYKFKSRQQAIAVGIAEARKAGGKVPPANKN